MYDQIGLYSILVATLFSFAMLEIEKLRSPTSSVIIKFYKNTLENLLNSLKFENKLRIIPPVI